MGCDLAAFAGALGKLDCVFARVRCDVVWLVLEVEQTHWAVPLEVGTGKWTHLFAHVNRSVDGQLHVVGPEPVTLRVRVREQARLQNRVVGRLDTRDTSVGRREGNLLNLFKVVGDVFSESDGTKLPQWELLVWPNLGQVVNRVTEIFRLLGSHRLHIASVLGLFATL
ncbi:hypothetical protein KLMA_50421 [Kluyveromyces marxianus]|nr:hypothetical protein KLMA_50421 [Kluyveromyces marxianus]